MMSLKRRSGKMKVVPMNKNTFKKLIRFLERIKNPLPPKLEPYLEGAMIAEICLETHDIHELGSVIDIAYYISYGYMLVYYLDEDGHVNVIGIFSSDQILAGKSFINGVPSRCYVKIFKGAYVLEITNQQMQMGYETIPGMDELARLTLASFEDLELSRDETISKGSEEAILQFYLEHPGLLPAGKIITDCYIASYLHMREDNLQRIRRILISKGLLPGKRG
jgi:CRP-like cAMP-binding protein